MIEIYYGRPIKQSFSEVIDQFSSKEINSLKTSTLPLLDYWKKTDERIDFLFNKVNIRSSNIQLCFEYPTRSYKSNKSSMTDLMIMCNGIRIAIECKFTEVNMDETINKWNKDETQNRRKVISHWLNILKPFTSEEISIDSIGELSYQFLHRTASACYNNQKKAFTIYQIFYDNSTQNTMIDFIGMIKRYVKLIKPNENLKFSIHCCPGN